jgi:alkylation response protein AidB-like acyl-CoA dehydrogenase
MQRTVFDREHDEFRAAVRGLVARELAPNAERHREERSIDRTAWKALGAAGFLGFMMPEEFGGGGMKDFRFNAVLAEELAVLGYAYASSFGINTDVVSPYLLDLASPEQQLRWIPRFCSGDLITAIALTEPEAGSDLAKIRTRAERDGDGWLLNGAKTFITNGIGADLVIVAARSTPSAGARGITLFAVERGAPGFERGRKLDKVGQPEADTAELFFTDVRVRDEDIIGEVDAGFGYLMNRLTQERLSCAISAVAAAMSIFTETLAYAKQRQAFGQAIGAMQHNKFTLATLATELDVTRAWVDQCLAAHVAGELEAADAAKAKYWATEMQNRVTDACLQLFGGYGYMRESRIARVWLDARVTRIFAGTSEIMREVIGRSLGL